MVASARLTGALLEHRLFDQGIVGVFPRDEGLLMLILGFVNSRSATGLIRSINPTANNSANYLKRIPLVVPRSRQRKRVGAVVRGILSAKQKDADIPEGVLEKLDCELRRIWDA
ncbi:MAG: hypothetical protein A2V70_17940 [Planctomycetes bacterium RBG_13_63_9]|nr:MAG: hypothetical protein A2V70_17940 [Planctomycetes bacterium RBG_13_63_9]